MKCPICHKEMVCMTSQHIKRHNMTMQEYREIYKDNNNICSSIHAKIDKNKFTKTWINQGG